MTNQLTHPSLLNHFFHLQAFSAMTLHLDSITSANTFISPEFSLTSILLLGAACYMLYVLSVFSPREAIFHSGYLVPYPAVIIFKLFGRISNGLLWWISDTTSCSPNKSHWKDVLIKIRPVQALGTGDLRLHSVKSSLCKPCIDLSTLARPLKVRTHLRLKEAVKLTLRDKYNFTFILLLQCSLAVAVICGEDVKLSCLLSAGC